PAAGEEGARRRRVQRQRRRARLLGQRLAVHVGGALRPVAGDGEVVPLAVVEVLRPGRDEDLAAINVDYDLVRRDGHAARSAPLRTAVAADSLPGRVRAPVPRLDAAGGVAAREERRRREVTDRVRAAGARHGLVVIARERTLHALRDTEPTSARA